ncbi:helix-turn-helix domain-containing protein [Mycobacterium palustre]|uniref:helix-turn-helix domain-containing protein n=1 Tax=Mycobacterium palustre TaxID=153971 RepID=UPI000A147576|nr:helix-turn-helix transcriptional regulator [Mycobacterium palustre]MCV7102534.1 helix-turn-helix transcriptional regulator [Mycobacterium palustre]
MTTSIQGLGVPPWDIADRLRKSLRESDIGVQEMADYLGVSRNTVSAWINGRGPINPESLPKWAELTGFPLGWLEDGDSNGPQPPRPPGVVHRRHPKARVINLRDFGEAQGRRRDELVEVSDDAAYYVALAEESTLPLLKPRRSIAGSGGPAGEPTSKPDS